MLTRDAMFGESENCVTSSESYVLFCVVLGLVWFATSMKWECEWFIMRIFMEGTTDQPRGFPVWPFPIIIAFFFLSQLFPF